MIRKEVKMKSLKTSSLFRLAALLLIAVITICMVGFVAEGWQSGPQNQPESGEADTNNNGDTDENTDGGGEAITPEPPSPPEYTHYLTGLEVTAEEYRQRPLCFVMDSASPLYGISDAPLMVEIPIEAGQSRLLVYRDHSQNLGKVGSITKTRECISRLLDFFGGISICNGVDGSHRSSGTLPTRLTFDLFSNSGYAYTENTNYLYSNKDLLLAGLQNAGISTSATEALTLPFTFTPYFSNPIRFTTSAQAVTLPYSEVNGTDLYYDSNTAHYLLGKGGQVKNDLLNGKSASFKNAFVLFADATTYESADQTEMTIDTAGGGSGYYFTEGTACTINWRLDATGNLIFSDERGARLTVNRGTSYIAFYKASCASNVVFN